jgi:hypothetical protein
MSENTMNKDDMAAQLVKQSNDIRNELVELEKQFNMKKEQFIKIQGALEVLSALGTEIAESTPEELNESEE